MSLQLRRLHEILKHQPSKSLTSHSVKAKTTKPKTTNWRYTHYPQVQEYPWIVRSLCMLAVYGLINKVKLHFYMHYPLVDSKVVDTRVSLVGSNYWQDQLE
jgi:hypothetical protein